MTDGGGRYMMKAKQRAKSNQNKTYREPEPVKYSTYDELIKPTAEFLGGLLILVGISAIPAIAASAALGVISLFVNDKDSEDKKPAPEIITGEHKKAFELERSPERK